jgi:hypothetical protein
MRFVRSLVLSLKEQQYIEAARAMGVPGRQLLSRHVLPAIWGLVLVQASFGVGGYMGAEATLSVLGLGVQRPTPDLGLMVVDGADQLSANTVEALAPSLLLTAIIVAFVFVGDGLRDAFDPVTQGSSVAHGHPPKPEQRRHTWSVRCPIGRLAAGSKYSKPTTTNNTVRRRSAWDASCCCELLTNASVARLL